MGSQVYQLIAQMDWGKIVSIPLLVYHVPRLIDSISEFTGPKWQPCNLWRSRKDNKSICDRLSQPSLGYTDHFSGVQAFKPQRSVRLLSMSNTIHIWAPNVHECQQSTCEAICGQPHLKQSVWLQKENGARCRGSWQMVIKTALFGTGWLCCTSHMNKHTSVSAHLFKSHWVWCEQIVFITELAWSCWHCDKPVFMPTFFLTHWELYSTGDTCFEIHYVRYYSN